MDSLQFSAVATLAPLTPMADGAFLGIHTTPDGQHVAAVLLNARPSGRMTWAQAKAWAASAGGVLPTRPIAAQIYALAKSVVPHTWHWTADELQADTGDEEDASYAWYCYFYDGHLYSYLKSAEGAAVAVRLIPLIA